MMKVSLELVKSSFVDVSSSKDNIVHRTCQTTIAFMKISHLEDILALGIDFIVELIALC